MGQSSTAILTNFGRWRNFGDISSFADIFSMVLLTSLDGIRVYFGGWISRVQQSRYHVQLMAKPVFFLYYLDNLASASSQLPSIHGVTQLRSKLEGSTSSQLGLV